MSLASSLPHPLGLLAQAVRIERKLVRGAFVGSHISNHRFAKVLHLNVDSLSDLFHLFYHTDSTSVNATNSCSRRYQIKDFCTSLLKEDESKVK